MALNLIKVIDSEGGHADSVYDAKGLLLNSTDFKGNTTRFEYDAYGNVIKVNYPVGVSRMRAEASFDYDEIAHSDVVKATDADGNSTDYEYDAKRRLKVVHFPDGGKVEYFYDISGNVTRITDSRNRQIIRFEYDILNRLRKKIFPTGAQVSYDYDPAGNLTKVTDPKGAAVEYDYYDNGWLKTVTSPAGVSSFEYTTSGDILRINLPDGNHVTYMWYLDHTIRSVTYPGNSTVETGYDLFGDVRWIEDAMGNRSGVRYDMLRQVSKTVRNLNGVEKAVEYEYNENGQVTKVTDQRGNSTRFDYDKQGNVWKIHYPPTPDFPNGTMERYDYDPAGNLTTHTDPTGKTTSFLYDPNGRVKELTRADGSSVTYLYDKNGNVLKRNDHFPTTSGTGSQWNPAQPDTVTDYQYDSFDRLKLVWCKDSSGKTLFRHKSEYDFTGAVTDFSDVFGYQYGTGVKYGQGTVIGQTDGVKYDHVYTFGTDAGTPSNPHTKYGGGNIGSQYGEPGYGAAIKYGQGTKSSAIHYNNLSRITEYTDFFGNQYHYGYDELTRPAVVQYPNGILTEYSYDPKGRLGGITHKRETGEILRSFAYEYDKNMNITRITNEDGSLTDYVYDDWNRLTGETWKNALGMTTLDIQYTFDNAAGDTGNIHRKIVSRNGGTVETTTFTYDEYNKLTTINHPGNITETLTHNANGQLTQSTKTGGGGGATETTHYYWNDQGFLTKVLLPSGEPVEYKYDGVGRLTGRKDADGEQIFVQSGWSIMTEQDTEGRRTYYTGSSSQTNNGEEANFFLFNHRGDTVLITDQTGTITNNLHYEAYGKVTDNTGTPIPANTIPTSTPLPPLFVGAYGIRYDRKTELSNMRMRWYNSGFCRFINSDLLKQLNRYEYTLSNPVMYIDPTGLIVNAQIGEIQNPNTPLPVDGYSRPRQSLNYNRTSSKALYSIIPLSKDGTTQLNDNMNPKIVVKPRKNIFASRPNVYPRYADNALFSRQQSGFAISIIDAFIRSDFSQNCHSAAAGAGDNRIEQEQIMALLNSPAYENMGFLFAEELSTGDVLSYSGHSTTVIANFLIFQLFAERDGNYPFFIMDYNSTIGTWGYDYNVFRPIGYYVYTYNDGSYVIKPPFFSSLEYIINNIGK